MLPGMSGLEVLRRRRADDDTAAVMILSALGDEDDRLLGLDLGADDYMVKPFSPRESGCGCRRCCGGPSGWGRLRCCRGRWSPAALTLDSGRARPCATASRWP